MKGPLKFMHAVLNGPAERRISVIRANKEFVRVIVDILFNILNKNIQPLSSSVIDQLRLHKSSIYKLIKKSTSHQQAAKILINEPQILDSIISLLPDISNSLRDEPLYKNVSHKRTR